MRELYKDRTTLISKIFLLLPTSTSREHYTIFILNSLAIFKETLGCAFKWFHHTQMLTEFTEIASVLQQGQQGFCMQTCFLKHLCYYETDTRLITILWQHNNTCVRRLFWYCWFVMQNRQNSSQWLTPLIDLLCHFVGSCW